MPLPSRSSLRILVTVLAGGLLLTTFILLACGPSTPARQEATPTLEPTATAPWLGTPPTESELATLEALPTATPYPADYVKPTEAPYVPPLTDAEVSATFAAEMATEAAEQPRGVAAPANTPTPTPTPLPLNEQVTQFAREGRYDVVAHVRAGASQNLSIPANFKWPDNAKPWDDLTRTKITAITVYYGTLADPYDLLTPQWLPWTAPSTGQEYILFINKTFAGEKDIECLGTSVPGLRAPGQRCFTQQQLDAMGGPGGLYIGQQAWIVDSSKTWRIPDDMSPPFPLDFDLTKEARAKGEILSLSELEAAIRRGLTR